MSLRIEQLSDCPNADDLIEQLASLHHAQWRGINPQRTLQDRIEAFQAQRSEADVPVTFVALKDGELLGSASLVDCDLHQRSDLSPWLASVFVVPEHRGQGLGNLLVQQVEEHARAIKTDRLYLFTLDRESFYARRGWQRFAEGSLQERTVALMSIDL